MSGLTNALTTELQKIVAWIEESLVNLEIPTKEDRIKIAAAWFDIAIECQSSMLLILQSEKYALCFAGQRVLFEALVRGLWVQHCADDKAVENFKSGQGAKDLRKLTIAIKHKLGEELLDLEGYRETLERYLHDFTHTGIQHILRRFGADEIGPSYSEREISIVINFVVLVGMQAAASLALIAGRGDLAEQTYQRMTDYASLYQDLSTLETAAV